MRRYSLLAFIFLVQPSWSSLTAGVLVPDARPANADYPLGHRVIRFNATNGNFNSNYLPPAQAGFAFPISISSRQNLEILLSDKSANNIKRYSDSGAFLGLFGSTIQDIRGISLMKNKNYLVCNGSLNRVEVYSQAGVFLGVFASAINPWFAKQLRDGTVLVALHRPPSGGPSLVQRYSSGGTFISTFASSINDPSQIHQCADGNIVICGTGVNGNLEGDAAFEYTPAGIRVFTYPLQGAIGVTEIASHELLINSQTIATRFKRNSIGRKDISGFGATGQTQMQMLYNTASPVNLTGSVTLQNWLASVNGRAINVTLVDTGTNVPVGFGSNLSNSGTFSIETTLRGTFNVYIKSSHWLQQRVGQVTIDDFGGAAPAANLINGDVDNDNVVSILDYIAQSDAYETAPGDPKWNPEADLDGDLVVSIFDYIILSNNFEVAGDDF